MKRDPISLLERHAVECGVADRAFLDLQRSQLRSEIRAALDEAKSWPEAPTSSLYEDVYSVTELTYREAIAAAIGDELEADPDVVFFGEDMGAAGGTFKTTVGLFEKFGPARA